MATLPVKRMWINQPSTLQPYHDLHGTLVLAHQDYDDYWRCYYLSGPVVSSDAKRSALSEGWPLHLQNKQGVQDALQS